MLPPIFIASCAKSGTILGDFFEIKYEDLIENLENTMRAHSIEDLK